MTFRDCFDLSLKERRREAGQLRSCLELKVPAAVGEGYRCWELAASSGPVRMEMGLGWAGEEEDEVEEEVLATFLYTFGGSPFL